MVKKTFFNYKVKLKIKTTTTGLKNELKYSPMSEVNTCIAPGGITLKNNSVKLV